MFLQWLKCMCDYDWCGPTEEGDEGEASAVTLEDVDVTAEK